MNKKAAVKKGSKVAFWAIGSAIAVGLLAIVTKQPELFNPWVVVGINVIAVVFKALNDHD